MEELQKCHTLLSSYRATWSPHELPSFPQLPFFDWLCPLSYHFVAGSKWQTLQFWQKGGEKDASRQMSANPSFTECERYEPSVHRGASPFWSSCLLKHKKKSQPELQICASFLIGKRRKPVAMNAAALLCCLNCGVWQRWSDPILSCAET